MFYMPCRDGWGRSHQDPYQIYNPVNHYLYPAWAADYWHPGNAPHPAELTAQLMRTPYSDYSYHLPNIQPIPIMQATVYPPPPVKPTTHMASVSTAETPIPKAPIKNDIDDFFAQPQILPMNLSIPESSLNLEESLLVRCGIIKLPIPAEAAEPIEEIKIETPAVQILPLAETQSTLATDILANTTSEQTLSLLEAKSEPETVKPPLFGQTGEIVQIQLPDTTEIAAAELLQRTPLPLNGEHTLRLPGFEQPTLTGTFVNGILNSEDVRIKTSKTHRYIGEISIQNGAVTRHGRGKQTLGRDHFVEGNFIQDAIDTTQIATLSCDGRSHQCLLNPNYSPQTEISIEIEDQIHTGIFNHHLQLDGKGKIEYRHGDKKTIGGQFSKGQLTGEATILFSNGDSFVGSVKKNLEANTGTWFFKLTTDVIEFPSSIQLISTSNALAGNPSWTARSILFNPPEIQITGPFTMALEPSGICELTHQGIQYIAHFKRGQLVQLTHTRSTKIQNFYLSGQQKKILLVVSDTAQADHSVTYGFFCSMQIHQNCVAKLQDPQGAILKLERNEVTHYGVGKIDTSSTQASKIETLTLYRMTAIPDVPAELQITSEDAALLSCIPFQAAGHQKPNPQQLHKHYCGNLINGLAEDSGEWWLRRQAQGTIQIFHYQGNFKSGKARDTEARFTEDVFSFEGSMQYGKIIGSGTLTHVKIGQTLTAQFIPAMTMDEHPMSTCLPNYPEMGEEQISTMLYQHNDFFLSETKHTTSDETYNLLDKTRLSSVALFQQLIRTPLPIVQCTMMSTTEDLTTQTMQTPIAMPAAPQSHPILLLAPQPREIKVTQEVKPNESFAIQLQGQSVTVIALQKMQCPLNGRHTIRLKDNVTLVGNFNDNQLDPAGVVINHKNPTLRYEGSVTLHNGAIVIDGTVLKISGPVTLEASYHQGILDFSQPATIRREDLTLTYRGLITEGEAPQDSTTLSTPNKTLKGIFNRCLELEGDGTIIYHSEPQRTLTGPFKEGKLIGNGNIRYQDNSEFKGTLSASHLPTTGTLITTTNYTYTGTFQNHQPQQGKWQFPPSNEVNTVSNLQAIDYSQAVGRFDRGEATWTDVDTMLFRERITIAGPSLQGRPHNWCSIDTQSTLFPHIRGLFDHGKLMRIQYDYQSKSGQKHVMAYLGQDSHLLTQLPPIQETQCYSWNRIGFDTLQANDEHAVLLMLNQKDQDISSIARVHIMNCDEGRIRHVSHYAYNNMGEASPQMRMTDEHLVLLQSSVNCIRERLSDSPTIAAPNLSRLCLTYRGDILNRRAHGQGSWFYLRRGNNIFCQCDATFVEGRPHGMTRLRIGQLQYEGMMEYGLIQGSGIFTNLANPTDILPGRFFTNTHNGADAIQILERSDMDAEGEPAVVTVAGELLSSIAWLADFHFGEQPPAIYFKLKHPADG